MTAFTSPPDRHSTIYLEHVHGFQTQRTGEQVIVTVADIERDADINPHVLRQSLDGWHDDVDELSREYLLSNVVIPNLPLGIYGDTGADPALLAAEVEVRPPDFNSTDATLDFYRKNRNSLRVSMWPVIGKLSHISVIRDLSLGPLTVDWFSADREGSSFSLFGGLLETTVYFDQSHTPAE